MEKLVDQMQDGPVQQPLPKRNRGWFRVGDRRINREGRPRGSKVASPGDVYCAPYADRLRLLFVPARVLAFRLKNLYGPWVTNLPYDVELVACQKDPTRDGFMITIRSAQFDRIAKGAVIPEFTAWCDGQKWMRWSE